MSPTTVAAFAAAFVCLVSVARADTEAGRIACEQDVEQIRQYIETHRSQLTPAERSSAAQRLGVAADQCRGEVLLGQTTLAQLRQDLRMDAAEQQAAERPER
ncbi:MAG: hypothetical protein ACM31L_11370 [Actinomycetota bacterium]